jgi:hypothetical protein
MLDVTKGSIVYNHSNTGRNVEYKVTKVTKGYVFVTKVDGNGTVQDKYNRRTGMLVNQRVGQNEYITTEKE